MLSRHFIDLTLAWPTWDHLPYEKEASYTICHSEMYASRLLIPVIPKGYY